MCSVTNGKARLRSSDGPGGTEEMIIRLRKELSKQGLDAGAETIAAHLACCEPAESSRPVLAVSTIWRILTRRGFVSPQPQKRPRSSWRTFCGLPDRTRSAP